MNFSQRKIVSMMLKLDPAQRPDANHLLREIKALLPATSSRKAMEVGGKPMRWIPQYRNAEPGTVFQQGLYSIFGWALTLLLGFFTFTIGFLVRYVMLSDQKLYLQSSRRTEYRFITAGTVFSSFGLMGLYFGKQYAEITGRAFYKLLGWLGPIVFALSAITVYLSINFENSWFYLPVLLGTFFTLVIYSLSWGVIPKEKLSGQAY
jgi:hypothetical protein